MPPEPICPEQTNTRERPRPSVSFADLIQPPMSTPRSAVSFHVPFAASAAFPVRTTTTATRPAQRVSHRRLNNRACIVLPLSKSGAQHTEPHEPVQID